MRPGLIMLGLLQAAGCNPYQNLDGDFYLGPVDAKSFPAAYLGAGFSATQSVGTVAPAPAATLGGGQVAYYAFPATAADPLTIDAAAGGQRALVYVFDGDASADTAKCQPPSKSYAYDARRDFVRFDRQGNIFEDESPAPLPSDSGYVPIYEQVPVTSGGEACNGVHSAEGLVGNHALSVATGDKPSDPDQHAVGKPDGSYRAMAMVDPRAVVQFPDGTVDDHTGQGSQRWGFYNHFLVAYLEGGAVPVTQVTQPDPNGGPDQMVMRARFMTLFAPNTTLDMMGKPVACDSAAPTDPAAPCVGLGFDLLQGFSGGTGARGDSGYSPICEIRTFTPADPAAPPTDAANIDPQSLDPATNTFIYCLQVAQ